MARFPQGGFKPQNGPVPQQIPNFQPRPTGAAGNDANKNTAPGAIPQGGPIPQNGAIPQGGPIPQNGSIPQGGPAPMNGTGPIPGSVPQGAKPGALVGPAPNAPVNGPMPGAIPPDGMSKKAKKVKTPEAQRGHRR